jgi:hypothetical protein
MYLMSKDMQVVTMPCIMNMDLTTGCEKIDVLETVSSKQEFSASSPFKFMNNT